MTTRRTFLSHLSLLGLGATAGCSDDTGDDPAPGSNSPTATLAGPAGPAATSTEADTPPPTSDADEPRTPTEELTSEGGDRNQTDRELAEQHISEAKRLFREFFDSWASFTNLEEEAPTIVHVYASATGFRRSSITDPLFELEEELRTAREHATFGTEQYDRITALGEERDFVLDLARWQDVAVSAFSEIREELEIWREESTERTDRVDRVDDLEERLTALQGVREDLDLVFSDELDPKMTQADYETEALADTSNAVSRLRSARRDFEDEKYDRAADSASIARRDFSDIADRIGDPSSYPPTDATDGRFVDHLGEWEDEADKLERSAVSSG